MQSIENQPVPSKRELTFSELYGCYIPEDRNFYEIVNLKCVCRSVAVAC
jgi:hypothetical protein